MCIGGKSKDVAACTATCYNTLARTANEASPYRQASVESRVPAIPQWQRPVPPDSALTLRECPAERQAGLLRSWQRCHLLLTKEGSVHCYDTSDIARTSPVWSGRRFHALGKLFFWASRVPIWLKHAKAQKVKPPTISTVLVEHISPMTKTALSLFWAFPPMTYSRTQQRRWLLVGGRGGENAHALSCTRVVETALEPHGSTSQRGDCFDAPL